MTRALVVAVVGVVVPACDLVFGIPHVSPPDAPPAQGPCSQLSMVADAFEAGDLQRLWPAITSASEVGGELVLDVTSASYASVDTVRYYDMQEGSISAKVVFEGPYGAMDTTELVLKAQDPGNSVRIKRVGDSLTIEREENHQFSSMGTVSYDPAQHQYWRIRNRGAVTEFAYSGDGQMYTTSITYQLGFLDYVRPMLVTTRSTSSGYAVRIDDVNDGKPAGSACKIASLTDTFDGQALGAQWQARSGVMKHGSLAEHDGVADLGFEPDPGGTSVVLGPRAAYDLTNGTLAFEIPHMIDIAGGSGQTFSVVVNGANGAVIAFEVLDSGQFSAYATMAGNHMTTGSGTYNTASRWLRFRAASDTVYWETSADGLDYAPFGAITSIFDPSLVDMTVEIYGIATRNGNLEIDNLNVPPS